MLKEQSNYFLFVKNVLLGCNFYSMAMKLKTYSNHKLDEKWTRPRFIDNENLNKNNS